MARATLAQLHAQQANSLGYLLLRCGQRWSELGVAAVNTEAGAPVLREAHTRLLPYLQEPGGIRITALAQKLGVTKQAVAPLVAELADLGLVRVTKDPGDARARRVVLTPFGVEALLHGTRMLHHMEAVMVAPHLGKRDTAVLKSLLARLLAVLET